MAEIMNIGRLLLTDNEGFIISESDKTKIKSPWKEAVEEIKEAYVAHLHTALHSIYVRGTVSRGEAVAGVSDIDTFAILNREIQPEDRSWIREVVRRLEEKYPFATDIEINLLEYSKLQDEKESFSDRFTIKVQSTCIYGDDMAPEIPPFKTDIETARHFHRDLDVIFRKLKINLQKDLTPKDVQDWCRWIAKRLIRAAFVLVMDKEKAFTRDLYPSYVIFSKYYPEKEGEMKMALELAVNPTEHVAKVQNLADSFGVWVRNEIEEKFK